MSPIKKKKIGNLKSVQFNYEQFQVSDEEKDGYQVRWS